MTGKLKSHSCFEWIFEAPASTCVSGAFSFLDREYYLEYHGGVDIFSSFLTLNSNKIFQPLLRVTVHFTFCGTSTPPKTHDIISTNEVIWINPGLKLRGSLLTFHVTIHNPSEDKSHVSTGCQVPEKTLMSSEIIHLQTLSRDFSKLLNESSSGDVKITCDGQIFSVHRNVLEARSSVLSTMLSSDMVEGKSGLVKVEDIEAPIFQGFLRYMYSGALPELNAQDAKKYYEVADKYDVRDLRDACSMFMVNNLSKSSACDVLVLADQHSDEDFRKSVISYMAENKIPEDDDCWLDFSEKCPILAVKVLNFYIRKTRVK